MIDHAELKVKFREKYKSEARVFRAPGRINLIGEHTDYNDGFVLPAAINFSTYIAGSVRTDRVIRVSSLKFKSDVEFDLDEPSPSPEESWSRYVQGVALILERKGFRLRGADIVIDSDVPVGAGLSSSAALEVATGFALMSLSELTIDGMNLTQVGQEAEHEFAGVRSGIMDQFASVFGQENKALLLDCRSHEWSAIDVSRARFVICNTKVKHDLAESEYNNRRAECELAASFFGCSSLRDVSPDEFKSRSAEMPEILKRRARHVISENQRVIDGVADLQNGDLRAFGKRMNESHESLRRDFEVSCAELDLMADLARELDGVLGSRMMGGGFGGCTINLVGDEAAENLWRKLAEQYHHETGIVPDIYECQISDGVREIH